MTSPPNKGNGRGILWLKEHAGYQGEACLMWPLFRDPRRGYGVVGINGRLHKAHRVMCEMVRGQPPES